MRTFSSYGPVNCQREFCVKREALVEQVLEHIIAEPDLSGHYFTIWAPRQSGKTWIMRQVKDGILAKYGERFLVGTMSVQGVIFMEKEEDNLVEAFLRRIPLLIWETFKIDIDIPDGWESFKNIFERDKGIFNKPVILFIDEFDSLPPVVIDKFVTMFRDIYLKRESYFLHGLALIGVRSVLGVESMRGSPFNVQRSVNIPNFTKDEVFELFHQYREESGQGIEIDVIEKVYEVTRGQPGLVCWFGELITEKYNPGKGTVINAANFKDIYRRALMVEWNNTILNLTKKAKVNYKEYVMNIFANPNVPFIIEKDWCNYLYMNGIIDSKKGVDEFGEEIEICFFSSPFVQEKLYESLAYDIVGDRLPILALDILDDLADVLEGEGINLPALLRRYKDYLFRLRAKGLNPWKEQPRRADLNYREAVGHFHLYAWLQSALGQRGVVSPEFPTGNGKVDLHVKYIKSDKSIVDGIIEVKSFTNANDIKDNIAQAVGYAKKLNKDSVTIALFVPSIDEKVVEQFQIEKVIEGVKANVVPIGWAI
ncbi:MAG: AAA-like domain-containing protein [Candidatus Magnetoovum sp. WYHC-5]|nr:AAA-like domain-containing protein [Candidatus Magnetoovum sp. WYHC-5]